MAKRPINQPKRQMPLLQLIKRIEQLSVNHPLDAISELERLRMQDSFYPLGAQLLVKLYIDNDMLLEAEELAEDIFRKRPAFSENWDIYLKLMRRSEKYEKTANLILNAFEAHSAWKKKLAGTFAECLLVSQPNNARVLIESSLKEGMLNNISAQILLDLFAYMQRLSQDAIDIGNEEKFWCLSLRGENKSITIENKIIHVNLSPFILCRVESFSKFLAGALLNAILAKLNWRPYYDDQGMGSWCFVGDNEAQTTILWQLLHSSASRLNPQTRKVRHPEKAEMQRGDLWIRPGNVELLALRNYLNDPLATREAAVQAVDFMYSALSRHELNIVPKAPWWPRTEAINNILRLSTNAGWYSLPDFASDSIEDWAKRYANAMCKGKLIAAHLMYILPVLPFLPVLRDNAPYRWTDDSFFTLLRELGDLKMIFVTPYADQIATNYCGGGIAALWAEANIQAKIHALTTIQAPMSIYPYCPGQSWSATYKHLYQEAARTIEQTGANVFLASCGCYGLPLVHEIHENYGITSIYYGHAINVYFGIKTNGFTNSPFYISNINSEHWIQGNLDEKYPEIIRIDGGRYA